MAVTEATDAVMQTPAATLCDCQAGCDVAKQLAAAHAQQLCSQQTHLQGFGPMLQHHRTREFLRCHPWPILTTPCSPAAG